MNINDFKCISNALSKTMHAVSLCFDKAEVNEASLTYDGDDYNVNFNCDIDEFGTGYLLSSSSEGVDVNLVIRDFYSNLILNIVFG